MIQTGRKPRPGATALRTTVAVLLVVGSATAYAADPAGVLEATRTYRAQHGAEILADFAELLRMPSVAADPDGLRRTAAALRDRLVARGVRSELLEIDGVPPLVWGRLDVEGATRTLGIYVHYDGQPVDPRRWTHPPFEPTLLDRSLEDGGKPIPFPEPGRPIDPEWRIYARASGDDKAPLPALFGALDALSAAGRSPRSNLVFLFEGEEEAGSDHLGQYFERWRDRFGGIDLWLICDGPVHTSRRPQLVFGVRGYTGLDLEVYGAKRYLHSGHYGNWAPNPALELARLLAGMKDANDDVVIEGFYDSVVPLTDAEHAALDRLPDNDASLRRELGLARTEHGNARLIDRILLPSLNIRGLQSATVGETARNIVPTTAEASIDIRLAKGNDPEHMLDLVERHIAARGFHIVRAAPDDATRAKHARIVRVTRRPGYPAVRTRTDLPVVRPIIEAARAAAGEDVILMPTLGGSLPLYLFADTLGQPVVIVPIANHDDNQHAPDENLRLANLWYGIDLFAAILATP